LCCRPAVCFQQLLAVLRFHYHKEKFGTRVKNVIISCLLFSVNCVFVKLGQSASVSTIDFVFDLLVVLDSFAAGSAFESRAMQG
jgi:hypothetical protein